MKCGHDFKSENCVCDILREIAEAQTDVITDAACTTSCEQSISDLMGDNGGNEGFDTVPVLLYCKGDCEPFKGFGAPREDISCMVASFYFRVKSVDDNCCAVLELLRDDDDDDADPETPVCQYTGELETTGICITVDLNCFCHVTCLPAIDAL